MCGIAGLFSAHSSDVLDPEPLWQMIRAIKNRGPDAQHVWVDQGVALAHARLSIIDLSSASDQPMHDSETGYTITFNGEIYNYLELRQELVQLGYHFSTQGDTEVILKAYQAWGADCLNRFNGMWAFALFDPRTDSLFCARDRFGIKPFIYHCNSPSDSFTFASETKALLAAFPEWRVPNQDYLHFFVETGQFAGSNQTFCAPIQSLLPGHFMRVKRGVVPVQERYFQWQPALADNPHNTKLSLNDAIEAYQSLLKDSIRLRFRSDVPVGICLSGGLDSTALSALAATMFNTGSNMPLQTFSCIYPDHPQSNEEEYIREMVARYDFNAHFTTVKPIELIPLIHQSLYEQDGPSGTPSILSQRAVMEAAHGNVTVVLSGQGSDEVLGGYHTYFDYALTSLMRQWRNNPSWQNLTHFFDAARNVHERTGQKTTRWSYAYQRFLAANRASAFQHQSLSEPHGQSALNYLQPIAEQDLSTKLLEDLTYWVIPRLLHYEDRNSMAFSLESRLPFLDYRLVQFAFSLPDSYKIYFGRKIAETKYLLKKMAEPLLPHSILARRDKMGFNTPLQHWFQDKPTQEALNKYINGKDTWLQTLTPEKQAFIKKYWHRCRAGQSIPTRAELNLWRFFNVCLWLDSPA
ncbi:MAG: asparagine synthase (glutamine-hydrolyzing) [Cyanobacteria bacterium]|nr:asparagine synthase (glutamine-hydrolyzing) [Cyanobacteriota bacterium]